MGSIKYKVSYAKTEVTSSISDDGRYQVIIFMIGEPDWPFGATHCRFDLLDGKKTITMYQTDLRNDGCYAHENNFDITWDMDSVVVKASASEQPDLYYRFYFDGKTEVWQPAAENQTEPENFSVENEESAGMGVYWELMPQLKE